MTGAIPPHGALSMSNAAGVQVTERSVNQITPVNRGIDIITNSILTLGFPQPFTLGYDKTNQPYQQYVAPIPPVLMSPWGTTNYSEGVSQLVYSLALFREAFIQTTSRDAQGNPASLTVLCVPWVQVRKDAQGTPTWWYTLGSQSQQIDPTNLTHVKLASRPGHLRAMTSIESANMSFALWSAAMQYGLTFFKNGSSPSFILSTDAKLTKEQRDAITTSVILNHSGLDNSHLPMMFDGGVKAQTIGSTPDQAQYLGTLDHAARDCATYFGLPTEWLTEPAGQNSGKDLVETYTWFCRTTLIAYLRAIEEAFSTFLPVNQQCAYNYRPLLRGTGSDIAREILAVRTATVMDPDELRREFYGLAPHIGGDGDDLNAPLASNQSPAVGAAINETGDSQ
jgi:HK97 family phage portal protein